MWKRLEIEDTSDCQTCQQRHDDQMQLLHDEKVDFLGEAWCQECGRLFDVMVGVEVSDG